MAPFLRGYAPTQMPADGCYQIGALVQDASASTQALGGDEDAVLVGHDWGALATYGAVAHQPARWRRVGHRGSPTDGIHRYVALDVRPAPTELVMFFFLSPLAGAALPLEDFSFIDHLWR